MQIRIQNLVLALAIYMPFEDFLLKWLPVPDLAYSLLRLASEMAVYGLFLTVVVARIGATGRLRRTPIDSLLLAFVCVAIVSAIYNDSAPASAAINLRTLLRYVALFYVVANLDYEAADVTALIRGLVACAAVQVLAVVLQSSFGLSQFWLPRQNVLEVAGFKKEFTVLNAGIEQGAVIGTLGHSVALALFILVAACLVAAGLAIARGAMSRRGLLALAMIGALLFASLMSYSKGALLCTIAAPPFAYLVAGRVRIFARMAFIAGAMLAAVATLVVASGWQAPGFVKAKQTYVDPLTYLALMFSDEFLARARNSRLFVLSDVGGNVLASGAVIGYGPDGDVATRKIAQLGGPALAKLVDLESFKDVYWVAILIFYGIAGVVLLAAMLWRLFVLCARHSRTAVSPSDRQLACAAAMLLAFCAPLNLLVRAMEFRSFSFYLWLLAGVVCSRVAVSRARDRAPGTAPV